MKASDTPGGKRLRALREFYGKTQLAIELDASLGIGYLQRLELGRVQQPEHDTLERILSALNASYTERREVLELFGYVVDAPLPGEDEIKWAIRVSRRELDHAVFPTYLLDCAHRLLYWNRLVPKLFNTSMLHRQSMLKAIFDPAYQMAQRIKNRDDFLPAQIRALCYEMQQFHEEAWYETLIEEMLQCEEFRCHWGLEKQEPVHIPARPLTPLVLKVGDRVLSFRLISERFMQDHRFRVIYCLPADTQTNQQCLDWMRE